MKKTDIAAVVLIAGFSVLVAYFIAKAVIGDPKNESVSVDSATAISNTLIKPDPTVFNSQAINPTVQVIIGNDSSSNNANTNNGQSTNNNTSPDTVAE